MLNARCWNPPFGHFGEKAISAWFQRWHKEFFFESFPRAPEDVWPLLAARVKDFCQFDGNCQGLRIVAKLQWNRDEFGLNLTHSLLAAYLKYPAEPSHINPSSRLIKKPGYFHSEADVVEEIWSTLGMARNTRHPLVYLMEAADDIAYCVSDIEDGIEKGLLTEKGFFAELLSRWTDAKTDAEGETAMSALIEASSKKLADGIPMKAFTDFRTKLTAQLSERAADLYVLRHEEILAGTAGPLMEGDDGFNCVLLLLRKIAEEKLYTSRDAADPEIAGFAIISGLLDHHAPLLKASREDFAAMFDGSGKRDDKGNLTVIQNRLIKRLPHKYRKAYEFAVKDLGATAHDRATEWYHRCHLVTDYIAGMTDDFALETFQLLSGIRIRGAK